MLLRETTIDAFALTQWPSVVVAAGDPGLTL